MQSKTNEAQKPKRNTTKPKHKERGAVNKRKHHVDTRFVGKWGGARNGCLNLDKKVNLEAIVADKDEDGDCNQVHEHQLAMCDTICPCPREGKVLLECFMQHCNTVHAMSTTRCCL